MRRTCGAYITYATVDHVDNEVEHASPLGQATRRGYFLFSGASNKFEPCGVRLRCVLRIGRKPMRTIAYALALALGVAFAASAFAADVTTAKTKADCDKAGGVWDATTNTCAAKQ